MKKSRDSFVEHSVNKTSNKKMVFKANNFEIFIFFNLLFMGTFCRGSPPETVKVVGGKRRFQLRMYRH